MQIKNCKLFHFSHCFHYFLLFSYSPFIVLTLTLLVKTEPQITFLKQIYGSSCEGPISIERVLKNAFVASSQQFFSIFLSTAISVTKCYPHAKFQASWTTQTEITGGRICPSPAIPVCKKSGLFRAK